MNGLSFFAPVKASREIQQGPVSREGAKPRSTEETNYYGFPVVSKSLCAFSVNCGVSVVELVVSHWLEPNG